MGKVVIPVVRARALIRAVRLRIKINQRLPHGVDEIRRNDIAGEGLPSVSDWISRKRVVDHLKRAVAIESMREITAPLRGRGHRGRPTCVRFRLPKALVGTIEIQMMAPGDRPAEIRAKLIAVEQALCSTLVPISPRVCVESRVPHVVVNCTVERIAATLCN